MPLPQSLLLRPDAVDCHGVVLYHRLAQLAQLCHVELWISRPFGSSNIDVVDIVLPQQLARLLNIARAVDRLDIRLARAKLRQRRWVAAAPLLLVIAPA